MAESAEALERRIDALRAAVRRAVIDGDRTRANALRGELRHAERAWDAAVALLGTEVDIASVGQHDSEPALLPVREQVHQALTLLAVPSAPKLVVAVHEALFRGEIAGARLTHLRRDEERSFRTAPFARPYYLCSALTADLLAPARGLMAVSTWSLPRRIVGPLSARVDFLTSAINLAQHVERLPDTDVAVAGGRLLWRFAANIPGAVESVGAISPATVAKAATAELEVHLDTDRSHREAAAARARAQLDDVALLFGSKLTALALPLRGRAT